MELSVSSCLCPVGSIVTVCHAPRPHRVWLQHHLERNSGNDGRRVSDRCLPLFTYCCVPLFSNRSMSDHSHKPRDTDPDNPYASPQNLEQMESSFRGQTPQTAMWLIFSTIFGFAVGAGSRYVRPMITGPVHYESLVAGILLILYLVMASVRFSAADHHPRFVMALVVVIWGSYFTDWSIVHGHVWGNLVFAALMGALASLIIVVLAMAAARWVFSRARSRRNTD
jgi:hypothetical protein